MKSPRRWVLAAGTAAVLTLLGTGAAQAATESPAAPAWIPCVNCHLPSDIIVFTPLPDTAGAAFECIVGYPIVSADFTSHLVSWNASTTCTGADGRGTASTPVHMIGNTTFYEWGSQLALIVGTFYNVTATSASSSGGPIVPPFAGLQLGVNHNILIDTPAGYTATVPSGCSQPDASQVACTTTTGPFTS